jgi:hypothetical protein
VAFLRGVLTWDTPVNSSSDGRREQRNGNVGGEFSFRVRRRLIWSRDIMSGGDTDSFRTVGV